MASKPARSIAAWAAVFLGLTFSGLALALEWNLQPAGSKLAADIHELHEYVMILCTAIFVGVFGFMFWSVYAHRKSKGHKAEQFHENTMVEMLWTVIPALILILIVWPAARVVVAQKDTSNPALTIKVTGYQWKWGYDYIKGEGVPIGKKVRSLTTAADVIHSGGCPPSTLSRTRSRASSATSGSGPRKPGPSAASASSCAARDGSKVVLGPQVIQPSDVKALR